MNNKPPLLQTMNLVTGYLSGSKRRIPVAGPLDLQIFAGQLICLLGSNGSGKSTLLRTLAGLQPPLEGIMTIAGIPSHQISSSRLARKISLVLTDSVRSSNLTVYSLVALGRYPYSNWLGILRESDQLIIKMAIEATGIEDFLDRKVATLSDGEVQKVMLARALAQDTPLMMLDEPTAHLDLPSRIQLMRLLHQLARQTDKGILVSTHELDLALQVADEVWLLQPQTGIGALLKRGTPEDLVLDGIFGTAFEKEGIRFDKTTGSFQVHPGNGMLITILGGGAAAFWTKRAVQRLGFSVDEERPTALIIRVWEENGKARWALEQKCGTQSHETMKSLLEALSLVSPIA
ncbi:MAG: ABC transporter ATP-binding protein [Puia sp.]|nr:ABC transporter ATP-binding protein [Puia sp.]